MDDEAKLTLHGLQQYYVKLKENEKNKQLFELLDQLEFNQVSAVKRYNMHLAVFVTGGHLREGGQPLHRAQPTAH